MRHHLVPLALFVTAWPGLAYACPSCPTSYEVWDVVRSSSPGTTIGSLALAFAVVGALIVISARFVAKARLLVASALLLGAGLGAFLDGIVLHQVLQWHAMLSSVVPPTDLVASKVNMFWDGVFHLFSWLATVVAVVLALREAPYYERALRQRVLLGGALAGWGYFNVVEGIIDHQVFGLHHVHPGTNELAWDLGFLIFGALLVVVGGAVAWPAIGRHSTRAAQRAPAT